MASKPTYKKRVISESDNDDSDGDQPLSATLDASKSAATNGNGSTQDSHTEGHPSKKPKLEVEDHSLRAEITATGFPAEVTPAVSSTGMVAHSAEHTMHVDKAASSTDDDDKPLASTSLPSFKKKKSKSSDAKASNGKKEKKRRDEASSSSSDDDKPLAAKASSSNLAATTKASNGASKSAENDDSSDDDAPLAAKAAAPANGSTQNGKRKSNGKKNGKAASASDSSDDDDAPLAKEAPKKAAPAKKRVKKEADSDSEMTDTKKKAKRTVKAKKEDSATPSTSSKKGKGKASAKKEEDDSQNGVPGIRSKEEDPSDDGGEDDEETKWWKAENLGDGSVKWTTLQHSGVLFPPEYTPLPSNVKLKYDGKPVDLPPEAEEVAGFFGAMLETDHAKDATFQKNFFEGFCKVLAEHPPRNKIKIDPDVKKGFPRLDFKDMYDHFALEREKKKAMTKDEKKQAKEEKDKLEEPYKTCLIDGRTEIVGNFRLEPPGLFRGRGEHPKKGTVKYRLTAEDITINIGEDAEVPKPPPGQKWGAVVHKNDVTWLATWNENINGATKYVFLAAGSSWKGQSDMKKFEKARVLKDHIDRIRADYERELSSKVMLERQRATAMFLIDKFALRVGGEKGEDEADTVGCCSLRFEHVTLKPPNLVTFDFLGKDSIRFYQPDKEVPERVFKNLQLFKKDGKMKDELFDRIKPMHLNKHFASYFDGLSAKVFRTYNASLTLQQQLENTPTDASVADKILHYNRANRMVAELCNHQRAASKNHSASMEKLNDKLRAVKYQRMKLRYALFNVEAGNKKKHKEYNEMESDIDEEWCEKHEADLVEIEKKKITKKFEKDNEKRTQAGEKPLGEKALKELLEGTDDMQEELKQERVSKTVEPKKGQTTAKILDALVKIDARIEQQKISVVDKEEGKEISLTTSKINYMDPRITTAWCKKFGVPLEKMFSKTLRTKFTWAMEVDEDWKF